MKLLITSLFLIITKVGLGQNSTYTQVDSLGILRPLVLNNKTINFYFPVSLESTFTSFNRNQNFYNVYDQKNDSVFIIKPVVYDNTVFAAKKDSFNPSGVNNLGLSIAFRFT